MFLTKEAVRLALPGYAEAVACEGCPPLARLVQQYADVQPLQAGPGSLGKMPTTSVRRLISLLSRSSGLVDQILRQCSGERR